MSIDCKSCEAIDAQYPGALSEASEIISDMLWNGEKSHLTEGEDGSIWIAEMENIDAANHVVVGTLWIAGVEYSFEAECGNNNGWVWRSLSPDAPIPDIEIHRATWDLQPISRLIGQAMMDGRGPLLVAKWDAMMKRHDLSSLADKYSYDKHFAPGIKTETYWRDRVKEHLLDIVTREEAAETRAKLLSATVSMATALGDSQ